MKTHFALLLSFSMLAVGGCNLLAPETGYVPQVAPPMADIPVPIGFDMEHDTSRDRSDGGLRWVDHRYSGKGPIAPLANFYEKQMPQYRWNLVTRGFARGAATLDFEKARERCRITISRKNSLLNTIQIHVDVWTHTIATSPATN